MLRKEHGERLDRGEVRSVGNSGRKEVSKETKEERRIGIGMLYLKVGKRPPLAPKCGIRSNIINS